MYSLKLIKRVNSLRVNCIYKLSKQEKAAFANSDAELYLFALKVDISVIDNYVTIFVYHDQNSYVLKRKNIFFYIALCIKI